MQKPFNFKSAIGLAAQSIAQTLHNPKKIDLTIAEIDKALKFLSTPIHSQRPNPATALTTATNKNHQNLTKAEQAHSAGLMRVNHVGEICAQALYQAQTHSTKNPQLKAFFQQAAQEETDHLAWTAERLKQLQSRPSFLNPVWYAGAYAIGCIAGKLGDTTSLSFLSETEKQVENHLSTHLDKLPINDLSSRAIVEQMKMDEAEHHHNAKKLGATKLPLCVRWGMQTMAKVMTMMAYRF